MGDIHIKDRIFWYIFYAYVVWGGIYFTVLSISLSKK